MPMRRTLFRLALTLKLRRDSRCKRTPQLRKRARKLSSTVRQSCSSAPDLTAIRIERPRELSGATWQIPFDGQNLYVTVNHDGKMIQEVFATGPISGGVGLLASKMLRGGFDAAEVAYSLEQSDRHARRLVQRAPVDFTGTSRRRVHHDHQPPRAAPAGLRARALAKATLSTQHSALSNSPVGAIMSNMIGICPECHGQLEHASGCDFCRDCGYSKCK